MRSSMPGTSISKAEVANIDRFGLWVLVEDKEYFLPHDEFPWFRSAKIEQILHVQLLHGDHLHWPDLDVDLCLDCLEEPAKFPLIYR